MNSLMKFENLMDETIEVDSPINDQEDKSTYFYCALLMEHIMPLCLPPGLGRHSSIFLLFMLCV